MIPITGTLFMERGALPVALIAIPHRFSGKPVIAFEALTVDGLERDLLLRFS